MKGERWKGCSCLSDNRSPRSTRGNRGGLPLKIFLGDESTDPGRGTYRHIELIVPDDGGCGSSALGVRNLDQQGGREEDRESGAFHGLVGYQVGVTKVISGIQTECFVDWKVFFR